MPTKKTSLPPNLSVKCTKVDSKQLILVEGKKGVSDIYERVGEKSAGNGVGGKGSEGITVGR